MSTNFFSKYPQTAYSLDDSGTSYTLTDISRSAIINSSRISDNSSLYTYYSINDGDRPDIVSYKLYNDVNYYWTFFIVNDSLRNGLNDGWPLSYAKLEAMIEREYAKYSVITFIPNYNINGTGQIDIALTPLDEKYLPYLRLSNADNNIFCKILKYDSTRYQLIIYDSYQHGSEIKTDYIPYNISEFKKFNSYRFYWDDSHLDLIANVTEKNIAKKESQQLYKEWLNMVYSLLLPIDVIGYRSLLESIGLDVIYDDEGNIISSLDTPQLSEGDIVLIKNKYIFDKTILATTQYTIENLERLTLIDTSPRYINYLRLQTLSDSIVLNILNAKCSIEKINLVDNKFAIYNIEGINSNNEIVQVSDNEFSTFTSFNVIFDRDETGYSSQLEHDWLNSTIKKIFDNDEQLYLTFCSYIEFVPQYDNLRNLLFSDELLDSSYDAKKYKFISEIILEKDKFTKDTIAPLYRYDRYYDAPAEFYDNDSLVGAYDIITNRKIVRPNYKTFYELEVEINDAKSQIKTIRPDKIADFADTYFNTLYI